MTGLFFVWLLRMRVRLSSYRLVAPPEGHAVKSQMLTLLRSVLYLPLFLTGACATTHNLTVHSDPEGATLTTVGTDGDLGLAPVLLVFEQSDLEKSSPGMTAVIGFAVSRHVGEVVRWPLWTRLLICRYRSASSRSYSRKAG